MDHNPGGRGGPRRRWVAVGGALVVIGASIFALRAPEDPGSGEPAPVPAPQTSVAAYAAEGVVVAAPGDGPRQPVRLAVQPGPNRLVVGWGPAHIGVQEPPGAAGYEVRWGELEADRSRLVAQPVAQIDGLSANRAYRVEVRSVDAFGRRSLPTITSALTGSAEDDPGWSYSDRFRGPVVPDPVGWVSAATSDCGRATRGDGDDAGRMVISGQCGAEPVGLRARAPLRLAEGAELGRVIVETDHPGQSGELLVDLVPGPADLVDGAPGGPPRPGRAGLAQDDPSLPPGAVRVRVAGDGRVATAQVLVAPGTPRLGTPVPTVAMPAPEIGVSVRWEVVLGADGVRVLRDGRVVGGGDVVPAWREATVLLGFGGGRDGLRAAVDLVALRGAPTSPPVLVPAPALDLNRVVVAAGTASQTPSGGARVTGGTGGQLRVALVPQPRPGDPLDDVFTVEVGGREFPARPAVPGQPLARGVRYPVVADVPADALVLRPDGRLLPVRVRGPVRQGQAPTRVVAASLELAAPPGAKSPDLRAGDAPPLPRTRPALARPGARFLDASGAPLAEGVPVPRGRLVLEITLDGQAGQRLGGDLAGLAGLEVRLDKTRIAGIPTVADGPGVAGTWRLALGTNDLAPGEHTVEVRAVGVDPRAAFAVAYAPFRV